METLRSVADVVYDPWIEHRPLRILDGEKLAAAVDEAGADILVVESDFVQGPVLERDLIVIGSCRGDPNNVDVEAATAAGIPVLRAPGRNADAVAELAVGLALAVTRRIVVADRDVRAGETFKDGLIPYQRFRAWQIAGCTVGLVGLGAVGQAAKWRFEGMGARVLAYDPYNPAAPHSLGEVLAGSDIVSLHAPVTPETAGMIGADQFAAMREGSVFLNTARADLHDTDALVTALESGHLGGAGLDHFEGEFLDPAHPLCRMDNVVLTPHIGGATYNTEANHSSAIADGIVAVLRGERADNLVNPEVLGP